MNSGILLVDKPQGLTSHDVVARIRKAAGTRKVGHAGTLDPMATGLLVLGLNSSTRLLTFLVGLDKTYTGTIRLGASTTTDDAEGEVVSTTPVGDLRDATLETALDRLRGDIEQVPTTVSAIKVDGKRAYKLAREGVEVELKARPVTIDRFEVLARRVEGDFIDLDVVVDCTSGTYIRALARDLGADLGVGGHLTALRRTRVGPFDLEAAAGLEGIDVSAHLVAGAAVARRLFPVVELTAEQTLHLVQGKRVPVDMPARDVGSTVDGLGHRSVEKTGDKPVAALTPDGRLAGLVSVRGGIARPIVNFPTEEVLA